MINKKFLLFFLCILVLGIFTTACGGGGKATPPNYPFIPVPTPTPTPTPTPEKYPLELSQTEFTINVGETDNITVTLNGEDITQTATYTVDEEAIVSVEQGLITGISSGFTTVTVHAENAIEDKIFTVNVIDPSLPPLELSKEEFTLNVGATDNITVILNGEDITETAVYTVDQEAIATVEKGLITGLSVGIAKVTVHADEAEADKTFTVNVIDASLPTLELSQTEFDLAIGETENITVTLNGEDITETATYTVDQEAIATVEKGVITGLSLGQTDVTVSLEGANNAIFTVNVIDVVYKEVELNNDVLDELYKLGKINKDSAHKTEITEINIPATYKSGDTRYKITSIGEKIFKDCLNLKKVTIPNSVITINNEAFYGTSIEEIIIPDSVTNLGYAVNSCNSLKKITIGDGVTEIKNGLFENLTALETVIIGKNLKTIELNAFYECTGLKSINFPNTLETIGLSAFYKCTGLESISLPNTLKSIDTSAFEQCTSLKEVEIPGCVEMNQDNNKEEGITEIGNAAFRDCTSLSKLTLGNGVKTIGNNAFEGCNYNQSPDTVNYELIIPDSVITIGNYAFKSCCFFNKLKIGTGIETIPQEAFSNCAKLEELEFKETTNIKTIGTSAFDSCAALVCTIPDQVTSIGTDAFQSVKHIYYNDSAEGFPWGAKQEDI